LIRGASTALPRQHPCIFGSQEFHQPNCPIRQLNTHVVDRLVPGLAQVCSSRGNQIAQTITREGVASLYHNLLNNCILLCFLPYRPYSSSPLFRSGSVSLVLSRPWFLDIHSFEQLCARHCHSFSTQSLLLDQIFHSFSESISPISLTRYQHLELCPALRVKPKHLQLDINQLL
jgi:hypothetical protein